MHYSIGGIDIDYYAYINIYVNNINKKNKKEVTGNE